MEPIRRPRRIGWMAKLIVQIKALEGPACFGWEIRETDRCGIPFNLALASSQESFASEGIAEEAGDRALAQFVKPVTGEQ
jgi:hypothetical protein